MTTHTQKPLPAPSAIASEATRVCLTSPNPGAVQGREIEDRGRAPTCSGDDEDEYQSMVFEVARGSGKEPKLVFRAIYEVLLGQERGPRFGTFVKLVGKEKALELIHSATEANEDGE